MLVNGLILVLMVYVTSKIILFITYLLEDEQELSLGMLDTSETSIIFDAPCLFSIYFALLFLHFEVFLYVCWY